MESVRMITADNRNKTKKGQKHKITTGSLEKQGNSSSTLVLPERAEWSPHRDQARQLFSSCLCQQTRGNKKLNLVVPGRGNPKLGREERPLTISSTPKRRTEPSGRLPKQEEIKRGRLDVKLRGVQNDRAKMGKPTSGYICLKRKHEGSILLFSEVGSSIWGGRPGTEVKV